MNKPDPISLELDRIGKAIVDCAVTVYKKMGPGLLESVYGVCLLHELSKRGHQVQRQVEVPVQYDGVRLEAGFRIDLLVDQSVIVEIKASEEKHPVHKAQVLTYLKLSGKRRGYLINFNVPLIRDGITRIAN